MNAATAFLDRFRRVGRDDEVLGLFSDDPAGFGAALLTMRDDLSQVIDAAVEGHGAPAMVHEDCFASAACDRHGTIVARDDRFGQWFVDIDPFSGVVRDVPADRPKVSLFADEKSGRPVALAAGNIAVSRNWPLAPAVREALASGVASYAVTAFKPGELSWTHTARAFSLTMAEAQLVAALARHGDLQLAANERGVAYETARKFVASAMRKTGTKRQTALIRQTLMVAAGDLPDAQNLGLIARDLFGLTPRQADLAVLLAHGATRERAASILGTTDSAAKSDLKIVFQACGVASAVDLSRLMTEINALKGLASACDVLIRSHSSESEPLQLVPRTWGEGRIAVSDHGPASGIPVVILHSNVSGRHHPRSFIKALRENGFRPITFDRAGYGLTTMIKGHPTETGVKDLEDVLDALGLAKVVLLARCNTGSAVATAAHATGRITGGVLLWPEAVPHPDRPKTRSGDWVRAIYAHFPDMAEGITRLMCRRTSAASIEKQWRYSARNVAADLALIDNREEREDLIRGAQQAVYGMHGFLSEALAHGNGAADPARIDDARRWTLIYSPGYEPGDLDNAIAHWSERLKGVAVTYYEDGGHFMHVTNGEGVIEALKRAV